MAPGSFMIEEMACHIVKADSIDSCTRLPWAPPGGFGVSEALNGPVHAFAIESQNPVADFIQASSNVPGALLSSTMVPPKLSFSRNCLY